VGGRLLGRRGPPLADTRTPREAEDFLDQERPHARQQTSRSMLSPRISVKQYAEHWLTVGVDQRPKLKPASKFITRA